MNDSPPLFIVQYRNSTDCGQLDLPPPLDTIRGMYILIGHASTPSKDSRPLFKPAATLGKRGGRTSWSL